MIPPDLTPPQIEALIAARDQMNAYRIREDYARVRRGSRYERAARTRVVNRLQALGLLDGSQITERGLDVLREMNK